MDKKTKLPVPRVEIHRYWGKHGGFDVAGRWLWRCYLVGKNGKTRFGGDWAAEGSGHPEKQYAQRNAKDWATFTGWPLVDRGVVAEYNEMPPRTEPT